jgi:hypothetical protein
VTNLQPIKHYCQYTYGIKHYCVRYTWPYISNEKVRLQLSIYLWDHTLSGIHDLTFQMRKLDYYQYTYGITHCQVYMTLHFSEKVRLLSIYLWGHTPCKVYLTLYFSEKVRLLSIYLWGHTPCKVYLILYFSEKVRLLSIYLWGHTPCRVCLTLHFSHSEKVRLLSIYLLKSHVE